MRLSLFLESQGAAGDLKEGPDFHRHTGMTTGGEPIHLDWGSLEWLAIQTGLPLIWTDQGLPDAPAAAALAGSQPENQ